MGPLWSIGEPKSGFYPVTWRGQSKLCVRVTQPLDMLPKEWAFAWAANEERVLMIRAFARAWDEGWEPEIVVLEHYAAIEGLKATDRKQHRDSDCSLCYQNGWEMAAGTVRAHAKKAKYAADLGIYMHALIENEVRKMLGLPAKPDSHPHDRHALTKGQKDAAEWGLISWRGWAREVKFRPIACELRGFHWDEGYAGTFDAFGFVKDELAIVDWKSSKGVHDSHHIQTGRYYDMLLWMAKNRLLDPGRFDSATHPIEKMSERGWILRLPKDEETVEFEAVRALPASATRPIYSSLLSLYREYGALKAALK